MILRKLYNGISYIKRIFSIISSDFKAYFPDELDHPLTMPKSLKSFGTQETYFKDRFKKEVLLRNISKSILKNSKNGSLIIDIGAYIGDNALVWAKMLDKRDFKILAIDPSPKNISWIKKMALINKIKNVVAINAICSDSEKNNFKLSKGSLEHGSFNKERNYLRGFKSSTLDTIIQSINGVSNVCLIHLDVEGMELLVLEGSKKIIDSSRPLILFEGHIKSESKMLTKIQHLLFAYKYQIFMINELLPGCELDCRNFLAAPNNFDIKKIQSQIKINDKSKDFYIPCMPINKTLIELEIS
ncbi:MAG: FkbM family methyltransferase [Prochlorococcus marinus CUG1436]|nr:FkbM family methyltransferase [Prochlorococcus marinus CUG1436]